MDLQSSKDESSVSFQSGLVSINSKCQILSGTNVSGFLEEPKTVKFVVQELFVGSDNVFVSSDQIIGSQIMGWEQNLEENSNEFDQESDISSPFYFKLLNPSPFTDEEAQENSSEMENIVSVACEIGVNGEEEPGIPVEGKIVENEDVAYEIELIPSSHSSIPAADQESDADIDNATFTAPQEIKKSECENWMGTFLDEADHAKSTDYDHENEASSDDDETGFAFKNSLEEEVDSDEEFIELEPQSVKLGNNLEKESDPSSCADVDSSQQKCWASDCDNDDDDEGDVLSQHQNLVQQMKMELKNCRIRGLPTISEEYETPKMIEDLRPLEIDHKIGYKDVMEGIQRFYKSYAEKMRKLDILNYQTSQAISKFNFFFFNNL